ncbi:MAG TPA: alpha-1,2-fucosyltransferase [Lacunisphaera sp.]
MDVFELKAATVSSPRELTPAARLSYSPLAGFLRLDRMLSRLVPVGNQQVCRNNLSGFDPKILELKGELYLDGYWQSPKYFEEIAGQLRREFTVRPELTRPDSGIADLIRNSQSVSLNVRRSDFVTNPKAAKVHGVITVEYYRHAERIIAERVPDPHFFVSSDDVQWCRNNLKFDHPVDFFESHDNGHKFANKFWLMTLCRHFIIPNSTYAWWPAWLNTNSDKMIVAPKRWFLDERKNTADLFPNSWIRI